MIKKIIITIIAIFVVAGTLGFVYRGKIRDAIIESKKAGLPEAKSQLEVQKQLRVIDGQIETVDVISVEADLKMPAKPKNLPSEKIPSEKTPSDEQPDIPKELNLDVPFTSQAPNAIWDEIHKDACEETSVLMSARFVNGEDILGPSDADKEILKLVDWQKRYFGFWKDTDAEKTAQILKVYYGFDGTEVLPVKSIEDIKRQIALGNPVIIPAAGRELGNPYYTPPGPYYHMLVVKGYTNDSVITNDPGTKRGENFVYKNDIFYNAIHDWNLGDVEGGAKVMIIVKK